MTHHYNKFKRYEDIYNSLSTANKAILQKAVLTWNDKKIDLDETEIAKLPQSTQNDIATLLEKTGFTSDN